MLLYFQCQLNMDSRFCLLRVPLNSLIVTSTLKVLLSSIKLEVQWCQKLSEVMLMHLAFFWSIEPSKYPLRPIMTSNACPPVLPRLLARSWSGLIQQILFIIFTAIELYDLKSSSFMYIAGSSFRSLSKIIHCCLLKWKLGIISILMWLIILPNQLRIIVIVGLYPRTINLILIKLVNIKRLKSLMYCIHTKVW